MSFLSVYGYITSATDKVKNVFEQEWENLYIIPGEEGWNLYTNCINSHGCATALSLSTKGKSPFSIIFFIFINKISQKDARNENKQNVKSTDTVYIGINITVHKITLMKPKI